MAVLKSMISKKKLIETQAQHIFFFTLLVMLGNYNQIYFESALRDVTKVVELSGLVDSVL